jgi:hypothetical protein
VILLEFAAQGVRGVAPAGGRATLRPGYNVVAADGAVLRRLLEALLHPDLHDADALPRAAGGPANAAVRAGLTLVGDDRVTYRLVRDFAAGAQLHRFDAEKRAFALVSGELPAIRRFLQETIGVPSRARLDALLSLTAAELPSRQGGAAGGVEPAAAPRSALSPELARKRISQLETELGQARIAEKHQESMDALQTRLFKVEEALRGGAKLHDGLERAVAARAELDGAASLAAGLGDAEGKLASFERASARRDEALAKVAAEREVMGRVEAQGAPTPFWRVPAFWPGVAGGAALVASGAAAAHAGSSLRHAALLAVPAFGWSAWCALEWIRGLEAWERVTRRRRIVDDWESKVEGAFERDAAEVRAALKVAGVAKPAELRESLSRIADADAVVAEWVRRVAEWESSPEVQGSAAEKAEIEEQLRDVEGRLAAEAGGFVRDVRSVETELQRLQADLAAPARAPVPPRPAVAATGADDQLRSLLERAAGELGGSPAAAARLVAPKASQALSGLSLQRLQALQLDERGNVQVQAGGRATAVAALPVADRDLVYLAMKLSLLEQALSAGKVVALADDAFATLPEGSRRFAARLLKQLARPGQLLHGTADPCFRETADHLT